MNRVEKELVETFMEVFLKMFKKSKLFVCACKFVMNKYVVN